MARPMLTIQRRRYKLFAACAVVMVFMLYQVMTNSWAEPHSSRQQAYMAGPAKVPQKPVKQEVPPAAGSKSVAEVEKENSQSYMSDGKLNLKVDQEAASSKEDIITRPGMPPQGEPESPPNPGQAETSIHWKNPPQGENQVHKEHTAPVEKPLVEADDEPHWKQQPERYPVPSGQLTSLPSGKPKFLPRVQFKFPEESEAARSTREKRLAAVKRIMSKSWEGYRKHAWMHDELSPVSGGSRDPFCGWAATLVDSLDTLWIAGLKEEFDEAAKAVGNIDFTTTTRPSIPVFETTIRYLGGLVAAFDVSGGFKGDYPVLLDKAIELAEILMGIFDTPNRMPVLYYNWRPESVAEPHMAGRVGIAELATLSMEFTRLAQLTGKAKYYDAVDRITNALVEMQDMGRTHVPGLFPENLDASGCNMTATRARDAQQDLNKPKANALLVDDQGDGLTAYKAGGGSEVPVSADDLLERGGKSSPQTIAKRTPPDYRATKPSASNEDCVPQGLVPTSPITQTFHMGGAQDSAYEYFPKQFALLGGLEEKYKRLHIDTVNAVREHLLYRPMSKDSDEWDVLFPAKATSYRSSDETEPRLTYSYEIAHLTCFIGGMFGLGAKLFEREKDLEIAKQLTDGCVWAYHHTATGLMPEGVNVLACPTLDKCEFNETMWWDELDSSAEWRDRQVKSWDEERAKAKAAEKTTEGAHVDLEASKPKELTDEEKEAERLEKAAAAGAPDAADEGAEIEQPLGGKDSLSAKESEDAPSQQRSPLNGDTSADQGSLRKREATPDVTERDDHERRHKRAGISNLLDERPLTHEEFVKKKIEDGKLAPGWTRITSKAYILRPEAIESVFYMYRLTGDASWAEKGWRMFQSTIAAVETDLAASAIADVTEEKVVQKDEMESFWIAETLKYYYLLFSEPDTISLDEWVLNTEAHPFKRPVPS